MRPYAFLALLLALTDPTRATGPDGAVEETGRPTLVLIHASADPEEIERGRGFAVELRLVLDDLAIRELDLSGTDFVGLPLSQQLERVRPLMEQHRAVAATWLNMASPELLLLHLAAVRTGRVLVRLVEVEIVPGSEANLALAARELLGMAYLFDAPRGRERDPVVAAVDSVRDRIGPPAARPERPRWLLALDLTLGGGLAGQEGPSMTGGGGLALHRRLVGELFGRVWLRAWSEPLRSAAGTRVQGWGLSPGLGLSYLWRRGAIEVGPALGLGLAWSSLAFDAGLDRRQEFSSVRLEISAGAELRWWVSDELAVSVSGGVQALPRQNEYKRLSTGQVVMLTPFLSWEAAVGILLPLGGAAR